LQVTNVDHFFDEEVQDCLDTRENIKAELDGPLPVKLRYLAFSISFACIGDAFYDLPVKNSEGHLSQELRIFIVPVLTVIDLLNLLMQLSLDYFLVVFIYVVRTCLYYFV
jgi:hypothetical protein